MSGHDRLTGPRIDTERPQTPLEGLTVSSRPDADAGAVWLLESLGAVRRDIGRADLEPRLVDDLLTADAGAGMPGGALGWAGSLAAALAAVGGWLTGESWAASRLGVAVVVWLPEVMAAAYESTVTMRPPAPVAFGSGWLHVDAGAPGDADLVRSCLASLPPGTSAHRAAVEAQAWRLAVCDYRPRVQAAARPPIFVEARQGTSDTGPEDRGFRVVDLTTMWAGPLATWLLELLGASVVRVEPSFRLDGFRAVDGQGIHPGGIQRDPGRDSAMFNALHRDPGPGHDLDLRTAAGRRHFETLMAEADLVVDSFSPRVMANLGYAHRTGGATRASLTAFGPGPEQDWIGYGTGVHASVGLGDRGEAGSAPGRVSYPDPLGGLALALGSAAAMVGRRRGRPVAWVRTSLAAAVQPLLSEPVGPMWDPDDGPCGDAILGLADRAGLLVDRRVGGRMLPHPATIFRSQ